MLGPRKPLVQVSLGLCLGGELEKIQVIFLLISLAAQSAGLLLWLPCFTTCGQGGHLPGPAYLRSSGIPASHPGKPHPALGALAEASEV